MMDNLTITLPTLVGGYGAVPLSFAGFLWLAPTRSWNIRRFSLS
jgi:hypothetical protein